MIKTALITGITGQDGSYLAELLLSKNYCVVGCKRRSSTNNIKNILNLLNNKNFILEDIEITDPHSTSGIIAKYHPQEIYSLAAQSHVGTSFEQPSYTFQTNAVGVLNILEASRLYSPDSRIFQASTSELLSTNYFIDDFTQEKFQNEDTPLGASSPYAAAKLAAHYLVKVYRNGYGLYAATSITHNHDSPRRGEDFVTRKITKYIGDFLSLKTDKKLKLGNIDSVRDFSHAKDMVRGMWMILQQDKPDDYMLASGIGHSVREFLEEAFGVVGLKWQDYVEIDPSLYRPCEVPYLCGRITKAKEILGWQPEISFKELVKEMVEHDVKKAKDEAAKKDL